MRIVGTLAKWLGGLALGVVLLLAVAFGAIQTPPGKAALARLASALASSGGLKIEISGITGFLPSDISVRAVTLSDSDGRFAEIEGLRLAWRPLALLGGRVDVADAGASRVALLRPPKLPPAEPAPQASGGGGFAMPVRIGRFAIDEIDIAEPMVGHAAVLSLTASAELLALERGLSATFDLDRRDRPGRIAGRLGYVPEGARLDLDVTAQEPEGGLVARAGNLPGLPALTATLKGSGPLDAWDGRLDLSAGDAARISGTAGIRAVAGGRRIVTNIDAEIARLLPDAIAPMFEGRTSLAAAAVVDGALHLAIEDATVRAAGFGAAVKGSVDPDAMAGDLSFAVEAGAAARFSTLAPGIAWTSAGLTGTLQGAFAAPAVNAQAKVRGLKGLGYGASALDVDAVTTPRAGGDLALRLDGRAQGLSAEDPRVAAALGTQARFSAAGTRPKAGAPALTALSVEVPALTAHFTGTASTARVDGALALQKLDLAAFAPLAGRPLAGTAAFDAKVEASGDLSRASLSLTGGTRGVSTGIAALDGLIGGATTVSGGLARDGESTVRVDKLALKAEGVSVTADGTLSRSRADLAAKLALNDVARLDPRVAGAVGGDMAFRGSLDDLGVAASLTMPSGTAMKQPVRDLALRVTGRDLTGRTAARFTLDGIVAGKPASGSGDFATLADGARQVKNLVLAIGSVSAKGDVALGADGLAQGSLAVAAGNLSDLSPLALTELSGRLNADVRLDVADGRQRIAVKADADRVTAAGQSVGTARIDASVTDPAGVPRIDGTVRLGAVQAGGVDIPRAELVATPQGAGTGIRLDAVVNGANLAATGLMTQQSEAAALRLDRFSLARGAASLATSAPANLVWSNGTLAIDRLALATRGGSATVSGKAGANLALDVNLSGLPLSLADIAAPGLGLSGTLGGTARIEGPSATPAGTYTLTVSRLWTPDMARNGAGPLDIRAEGRLGEGRVTTRTTVNGPFLTGVTLTGSAPLGAGDLDLAIRGALDLAVANPMLATSGAQVRGRASVDATVRGTAAAPRAGGTVRISGARFDDGVNGVSLTNIEGVLTGTDRSVTLSSLSAKTPNGGGLTARGSVALDPARNFPGRIDVDLSNAGLVTSDLMRLVAEGRLAVEGAFADNPRVTGRLVVRHLDVNIAERLPGGSDRLNVRHVNGTGRTAPRSAGRPAPAPRAPARADAGIPLDLTVSAPNNVFVRGMGLEAELGGDIKVGGTSAAPSTIGGFEMRRGTFDFIGKRLTFTRGRLTFNGTTDPELDFVAETSASEITAQILVTGPASRPEVSFTSTPTLPQDEVLSRLMFGRAAGSLTAGQALQVAQTVAQFSGGAGMLDRVRRSLGVDSLAVGTNSAGTGGQVGIGKRLNDRMYLGVRQGTTPNSSQVTVDIDITRNIRLQGATGADGAAEVGIGAQWDY